MVELGKHGLSALYQLERCHHTSRKGGNYDRKRKRLIVNFSLSFSVILGLGTQILSSLFETMHFFGNTPYLSIPPLPVFLL